MYVLWKKFDIYINIYLKGDNVEISFYRDNDRSSLNCASMLKGGWWWKSCGRGLNGLYLNDPQDLTARQGIYACIFIFIFTYIIVHNLIY